jgi:hypothetical protein
MTTVHSIQLPYSCVMTAMSTHTCYSTLKAHSLDACCNSYLKLKVEFSITVEDLHFRTHKFRMDNKVSVAKHI